MFKIQTNPFSPQNEEENYKIYNSLLEKDFRTRFLGLIYNEVYDYMKSEKEKMFTQIEKYRKENSPELLEDFRTMYQELTILTKSIEVSFNEIKIKSKKVFDSSTLCEDVFKIKDELKEIKRTNLKLNKFVNKLEKVFGEKYNPR